MAITQKIRDSKRVKAIGQILSTLNPFKSESKSRQKPLSKNSSDVAGFSGENESESNPANTHRSHKVHAKSKGRHPQSAKAKKKTHHHHARKKKPREWSENLNAMPHPMSPLREPDPAHKPGHQKLRVKNQFPDPSGDKTLEQQSSLQSNSRGDQMARLTTPQIRVQSPSRKFSRRGSTSSN